MIDQPTILCAISIISVGPELADPFFCGARKRALSNVLHLNNNTPLL